MEVDSYIYGSPVYFDQTTETWHYMDGQSVPDNPAQYRPCPQCHKPPTPEGHDACLGTIPGALNACCGHGVQEGYVQWERSEVAQVEMTCPRWLQWFLRFVVYGGRLNGQKPIDIGIRYYYNAEDVIDHAVSRG
jgi:hypothetical protein